MLGLIKRIVLRLAQDDFDSEYMVRYYPFFTNRVCINVVQDADICMHSHPWNYVSVILYGGYTETTPKGTKTYKPFSILKRKHSDFHKLSLIKSKCISILFMSKLKANTTTWIHNGKKMTDLEYQLSLCNTAEKKVCWKNLKDD